tara:strand:+ start:365 stop:628 length:264 start_codon:yes stop_codon:yes gene_type:complete
MADETKKLLEEIKAHRNDMVARNYPFQEISNLITKWETIMREKQNTCSCGRSPTGSCIGWHKLTEEHYKKSLAHYNKRPLAIDGVGE